MGKVAAVIGANGQLGSDLVEIWSRAGYEVVPLTHEHVEVENPDSVDRALGSVHPAVVLNTAAFHNVIRCEEEPEKALSINALGALNVSRISEDLGATHVYFSTDYVFDGSKREPYVESDLPNPLNVYATSKLAGENLSLGYCSRCLVIRISGIYGKVPCRAKGGNFVTTMIRLASQKPEVRVVDDEILSPTPTEEIARHAVELVESGAQGLFHMTSEGSCSWFEFASAIFETLEFKATLVRASAKDFPSSAKRPSYSVLENEKMKRIGLPTLPHWKDSLASFLKRQYRS